MKWSVKLKDVTAMALRAKAENTDMDTFNMYIYNTVKLGNMSLEVFREYLNATQVADPIEFLCAMHDQL